MADKVLTALTTLTASLGTYVAAANSNGVLGKIDLNAVKALVAVAASLNVSTATPSTNPGAASGNRMWVASTAGTYTNFAGIVLAANEVAFIVDTGATFSKVTIPIDLSGYVSAASIVDNLTSTSTTTPLSANMGRALSALIPSLGLISGKNMFDPAAATNNFIINYTNGALAANTNGQVSDFMPVLPSTTYTISGRITSSGTRGVAYYDSTKTLINTPSGTSTWGDGALNGQYTTPATAAYMRIATKYSGTGDPSVIQVEKGSVATAYEAYYTTINTLSTKGIAPTYLNTELGVLTPLAYNTAKGYSNVAVTEKAATINLFDKAKDIAGFHINNTTGLLTAGSGSIVSALIPVKPSTSYYISGRITSSGTHGVAYYDSTKTFINTPTGVTNWGDGPLNGVYTTTASTYYMQITVAFVGTGDPNVVQVEEGTSPSTYVAYSGYNAITSVNGGAVYANDDITMEKVKTLTRTKWYAKKICWMGTSIPANYPNTDKTTSYPNIASAALGATIINEALASSLVRIATSTGGALATNFQQVCFGMTAAELTAAQGSAYAVNSYETKMLGHLDADLFVFDFGYNDYSVDNTSFNTMPANPRDRNTFIGSMNNVISLLLQSKPKARFALFGHYENQYRPAISQAQQVIADYWGCYLFKTWERTNWSQRTVPGTGNTVLNTWLPDNIHPGADTTGAATALLSNLAQAFLMSL